MPATRKPSTVRSSMTASAIAELPNFSPRMLSVPGAMETNAALQQWWDTVKKRMISVQDNNTSRMTQILAQVSTPSGSLQAQITAEVAARIAGDTALASSITSLSATVGNNYTTLNAAIVSESVTRANADTALATDITTLTATVNSNYTTLAASVTAEAAARASADSAEAATRSSADATLTTAIGTVSASVTTETNARVTADGFLSGKYTLKVAAGDVVTGMNITSSSGSGTDISDVTFVASNFKIYNGTTGIAMFTVAGSTVNLANTLTVSTSGKVFIGTGTYGNTNTAWYVDSAGQFSLKDKLTWDGTTLTITGAVTATTGAIGGFSIGADYIRDSVNSFGMASTVTGGDDVRFWAGDTFANRAIAPFRITEAGSLFSTSGTIGGFTLSATTLSATGITLDSSVPSIAITGGAVNNILLNQSGINFSFGTRQGVATVGGLALIDNSTGEAANYLRTGLNFTTGAVDSVSLVPSSAGLTLTRTGGGAATTTLSSVNGLIFTADTNLYRSAANTLKTDDAFIAAGGIVSTAIGATTPSTGAFTTLASSAHTMANTSALAWLTTGAVAKNVLFMFSDNDLYLNSEGNAASSLIYIRINNSGVGYISSTGLNSMAIGVSNASTGAFTSLSATGAITLGTPMALAYGGTGVALSDPNADNILFWDDSAGQLTWLTLGTNLSISGTTLNASGGGGTIGGSTGGTDNRILRADGTGGATLQNTGITIDDSDNVTGAATYDAGTGGYKVSGTKVVGAQAATEVDFSLSTSVTGADLVNASTIGTNFGTLNTKLNTILGMLRTHGLIAT